MNPTSPIPPAPTPTFDEFLARLRAEADPRPSRRYGHYRSYRGVFELVGELRDRGARVECFGRSARGEPMWAVRLGALERPRARVLYLGGLHAQEFVGVEAALATLARAAERLQAGDALLEGTEITAVPTANPDGYRTVAAEAAGDHTRFHRRNARGVDLNRNFAEGFDPAAPLPRLLPWIFNPGRAPLSEPETRALDQLFARRYDRALSFHSFGGWIFWPWAGRTQPTADEGRFLALAARMRSRMQHPYRAVQLGRWARWFRAGGAEIDHLYGRYGTLAFLLEVSDGGRQLGRPATWLDAFSWYNPSEVEPVVSDAAAAALALAEGPWERAPARQGERPGEPDPAAPPAA